VKRLAAFAAVAGALVSFVSPASSVAEESLSGVYLFVQTTTSITKMPVLADVVATTRAVSIQRLTFDGEWLRGSGTLCDVQMRSSSRLVKTILPPAFRRALPPVVTNARLKKTGGTMTFHQPPQTLVIGAELEAKHTDPLPKTPHDSRVRDHDEDGKPGVTVLVSGIISGEIYLVQRSTSHLTGHATPDGFQGTIYFSNDQSILDATKGPLKRNPNATPDPNRSEFVLRKVNPNVTCSEAQGIAGRF
jgi:hypothetical protein